MNHSKMCPNKLCGVFYCTPFPKTWVEEYKYCPFCGSKLEVNK